MEKEVRIIIAGSRGFENFQLLVSECDDFIRLYGYNHKQITIITGGAKGADNLGRLYATLKDFRHEVKLAKWTEHGMKAGRIRNQEMADYACSNECIPHLIAFWDEESIGTKNMIDIAKKMNFKGRVVLFKER